MPLRKPGKLPYRTYSLKYDLEYGSAELQMHYDGISSRARVLLVWGSRDSQVPFENAERYAAVLSQARVPNRIVTIDGGDHDFAPGGARAKMTETVAEWMRESLA